ncbi:MAG TPA: ATP-binding protein [Flavobacteriales bacterium]|nr:ATP-binding protein [Flavobacteriales bacterium]
MSERKIRVLFVDDEESNLKAFKSSFRRDMDVLLARSGAEALGILDKEEVHVVVSDQRMPVMTGSEFLSIVRERHPKAMRMLLTGFADLEAVVAAVNKGGIYSYATKPWDENDLKLRIQQAFEIQQLRDEKERLLHQYRQVFEASADPIVIVDHRGRILEANNACAKLIGMRREDFTLARFTDHLEHPKELVRSLKQRRSGNEFVNVDLTLRGSTGNLIDCLMTATYLGKQHGGRDVFQAIIKDVTDRKQEENRLKKLNIDLDRRVSVRTSQLLEALEDLGSFSYSVAHDLRSPLKNIAAMSEMLHSQATEPDSAAECQEFAGRIHKGAQHMITLVDDLLRFSQTNTRELERKPVAIMDLVRQAIAEQVPDGRKHQITIDVAPGAELIADAPMLKVVLHNLLSNALKFTRTALAPAITIGHRRDGDNDLLWVQDNGVGFDSKHKDQVFGVFKRLHPSEQFEGTGVGLAIVHRIVTKHGGQVWAESAPGQGTTIHLSLPTSIFLAQAPSCVKVA